MNGETILVLGLPPERLLARLRSSLAGATLVAGTDAGDFRAAAPAAAIALAWACSRDLLARVLSMAPRLGWLHIASAGFDHLVSPELAATPAAVTNARGVFSPSLGEWALAAILYFAKDFRRLIRSQAAGRWDPFEVAEVAGRTVGIVGYGDIGCQVAVRCRAMGMRVLGLTRRGPMPGAPADAYASEIFGPRDVARMMAQCDYVVVAAPLTAQTLGLVGEAGIAAMKPDAVLVNVGRGPVVAEEPLVRALRERRIRGAALDVFHREPLPGGDPLYSLENVLLSPHSADHTAVWLDGAMDLFLENLRRHRAGETLVNPVDAVRGY